MRFHAVGFDLGHTLTYHPGVPVNWQHFNQSVLAQVAEACACRPDAVQIMDAEAVLCRYDASIYPRSHEVSADTVFTEILQAWRVRPDKYLPKAIETYFRFFQQRGIELFDDVLPALRHLRANHLPTGILSDAPYGMPAEYYAPHFALLDGNIDVVLTSVDVGYRKPAPAGYLELARRLGTEPAAMVYIGDEDKDIIGAQGVGMFAIYMNRQGSPQTFNADCVITSLDELSGILGL